MSAALPLREECPNTDQKELHIRIFFKECYLVIPKYRSSHPEVSCKKGVLKNFEKFANKHLCWSLFFNKVATLLKKRLWHKCFHVIFAKISTPFLKNICERLLLQIKIVVISIYHYQKSISHTPWKLLLHLLSWIILQYFGYLRNR